MRVRVGLGTIGELYRTLVENGRWWMVPMIAILGLTSLLRVAIAAIEYVAPLFTRFFETTSIMHHYPKLGFTTERYCVS